MIIYNSKLESLTSQWLEGGFLNHAEPENLWSFNFLLARIGAEETQAVLSFWGPCRSLKLQLGEQEDLAKFMVQYVQWKKHLLHQQIRLTDSLFCNTSVNPTTFPSHPCPQNLLVLRGVSWRVQNWLLCWPPMQGDEGYCNAASSCAGFFKAASSSTCRPFEDQVIFTNTVLRPETRPGLSGWTFHGEYRYVSKLAQIAIWM